MSDFFTATVISQTKCYRAVSCNVYIVWRLIEKHVAKVCGSCIVHCQKSVENQPYRFFLPLLLYNVKGNALRGNCEQQKYRNFYNQGRFFEWKLWNMCTHSLLKKRFVGSMTVCTTELLAWRWYEVYVIIFFNYYIWWKCCKTIKWVDILSG